MVVQLPQGMGLDEYDRVTERALADGPPRGLMLHSAGVDADGGFTVVDIWQSEEDLRRFEQEKLIPAIVEVIGEEAARGGPEPAITELHNLVRS
jgi:hypothetical protein